MSQPDESRLIMSPLIPKQCILVVDDSPDNIDLLSEVLRDDYRIRVATSGEKALKIVYSDEPPDLVLLDIMMPGLSGLEICRRLKASRTNGSAAKPAPSTTSPSRSARPSSRHVCVPIWRCMTSRGSWKTWFANVPTSC